MMGRPSPPKGRPSSPAWRRTLADVEDLARGLVSHNIRLGTKHTSVRLDVVFWRALIDIATRERMTVHQLCTAIVRDKPPALSATVAIRCYVLTYFQHAATDHGHRAAGHGSA